MELSDLTPEELVEVTEARLAMQTEQEEIRRQFQEARGLVTLKSLQDYEEKTQEMGFDLQIQLLLAEGEFVRKLREVLARRKG